MRVEVANSIGAHAFEDRITKLSQLQLQVLYMQAVKTNKEKRKEKFDFALQFYEAFSKKLEGQFELLRVFVNLDMFKQLKDLEEIEEHRDEVSVDNFAEEWEKMMEYIPETYIVTDDNGFNNNFVQPPDELDEIIAGWVNQSEHTQKER